MAMDGVLLVSDIDEWSSCDMVYDKYLDLLREALHHIRYIVQLVIECAPIVAATFQDADILLGFVQSSVGLQYIVAVSTADIVAQRFLNCDKFHRNVMNLHVMNQFVGEVTVIGSRPEQRDHMYCQQQGNDDEKRGKQTLS